MSLLELEARVESMIKAFRLSFSKLVTLKGISTYFVISDFGLVVCCINRADYAQVSDNVSEQYKGWRFIYITPTDNVAKTKDEMLWALMRGGYMKWLRHYYPNQLKQILDGADGIGKKVIEERIRIWGDKPMYKFLVEDNKSVLRNGILREYGVDPGFFDYMPEVNQ